MSDIVRVPYGEDASETATLLLAAAEVLEMEPDVVRTTSRSEFLVPSEVAEKAGVHTVNDDEDQAEEPEDSEEVSDKGGEDSLKEEQPPARKGRSRKPAATQE